MGSEACVTVSEKGQGHRTPGDFSDAFLLGLPDGEGSVEGRVALNSKFKLRLPEFYVSRTNERILMKS